MRTNNKELLPYLSITAPKEEGDVLRSVVIAAEMQRGDTLPLLQASVGGYVDCFDIRHPETDSIATVWINDEGKINGLERNFVAEALAVIGGWQGLAYGDWIAGDVALTGHDPETGDTIGLPPEWLLTVQVAGLIAQAVVNA